VPTGPEGRAFLATAEGARERAPVALALGTGLRVSELVNVRLGDFSQDEDGG
jgi:integrase